jgi:tetratricopeptide (TPR) repeat protein
LIGGTNIMCQIKSVMRFNACIFSIGVFLGCAGPATNIEQGNGSVESLRPGYVVVYHPKLQPGATLDSVQETLDRIGAKNSSAVFVSDDTPHYRYWHILLHMKIYNNPIELKKYSSVYNDDLFSNNYYWIPQNELPLESIYAKLFNYNLLKYTVVVERRKKEGNYPYVIFFNDLITFRFYKDDLAAAHTMADALYFLQQEQKTKQDERDKEMARFQPIAAQYRALAIKPPISEEQRKYIVQANALANQKQYERAEEKYLKAIELDPTSYPGAYFNMALLAAQENRPVTAIFRMKQYLLLMPDAKDARSAQDKIYEWEGMIGK